MLDKYFDFKKIETDLYQSQKEAGYFKAGAGAYGDKESFCVMMPPPNVTGSLHMGHALNNTIQDAIIRRMRMKGYDVLWQVGSDHAGIATQSLVERQLHEKGQKRSDMSREEFTDHVWKWKAQSGGTIMGQLQRLGASCDFSRERFTMDEGLSKAVQEVFVKLYKDGLIYKDKRLVNWDCTLKTAISDLEVVSTETKGHLYYFRYDIHDSEYPEDHLVIATTRPETMFGDMAVAVHPEDARYQRFIGKFAVLPVSGRLIPIIADEYADPETGTGAVKITPAHDFNDFEVGKRHNLEVLNIINPDGTLNENCSVDYRGVDRFTARKNLVDELQARDYLVEIQDHLHAVPFGDRSNSIIEPYLTDQWYVNVEDMAQKALQKVKSEQVRFIPPHWDKTYYSWLENIQPWCISRQLWWGHQIPAWYDDMGNIYVAKTQEEAEKKAYDKHNKIVALTRDEDVLDTWFSSALWPFSTLGWPEKTPELDKYYPTQLLVTGFDIIFFWVARMMMMGEYLTGKSPFKDIYIHALVRDEKGQKMSKSKGNVMDPLVLMDQYGADAVRFTLMAMAAQGRDIKLSSQRVEGYRNFGTKLWNAAKFSEFHECHYDPEFVPDRIKHPLSHWIIHRLKETFDKVNQMYDAYRFNDVAGSLYHFIWSDICDRYLEMIKPILSGEDEILKQEIRNVTAYVMRQSYILLHPIMPFITEALAKDTTSGDYPPLIHTKWPDYTGLTAQVLHIEAVHLIIDIIDEIRSLRSTLNVPAKAHIDLYIHEITDQKQVVIADNMAIISRLTRIDNIHFTHCQKDGQVSFTIGDIVMVSPLSEYVDLQKEKDRLKGELEKISKERASLEKRLSNERFLEKAESHVIEESKQRFKDINIEYNKIEKIIHH